MQVILTALGGGTAATLTEEGRKALLAADLILGAERLLGSLPEGCTQNRRAAVKAEDILSAIQKSDGDICAVLFSGDTGFYSGCRRLFPLLQEAGYDVSVLPGISSVQLLSARLGRPWQAWHLVSAHGLSCNAAAEVMQGQETFFLTGGKTTPATLCGQLTRAGLGDLAVTVGENLSYPEETICHGTAAAFAEREFAPLSVLLAEKAPVSPYRGAGLPDDLFLRGNVPMTKREVRAAILSKLAVQPKDILWDIGGGTGSVSVELALAASRGQVYAVECEEEACELIRKNREKFCAWNLSLVEGKAPMALAELPAPDGVFIGGTKGEMAAVIKAVMEKNPKARICISAIAMETLTAAVAALQENGVEPFVTQISVSKMKKAGELHLLLAQNPIFLITGGCHE